MPVDINRLRAENQKSLTATDNSIARLRAFQMQGPPPPIDSIIAGELSRAVNDKVRFETIRAHLKAGAVIVNPLPAETVARLEKLADVLDKAILSDFVINSTLGMVVDTLKAAKELNGIIRNST